ncbi:hypothetical protein BGZ98_001923 [Dissophora globulifera]|nr:hypothetical protein BGZ98_001923 [Dissophora globulifera]
MFARQVDPLAEYSSAISAAEQHHRARQNAYELGKNHSRHEQRYASNTSSGTPSQSPHGSKSMSVGDNTCNNPYKRKHPLQFESDFFAALDSSLKEHTADTTTAHAATSKRNTGSSCCSSSPPHRMGSSWSSRPFKRSKKSTLSTAGTPSSPTTSSTHTTAAQSFPLAQHSIPVTSPRSPGSFTARTSPVPRSGSPDRRIRNPPVLSELKSCSRSSISAAGSSPPLRKRALINSSGIHSNSSGPSIIDLSSGEELVMLHLGENDHKRMREGDPLSPTAGGDDSIDPPKEIFEFQDDGSLLPITDRYAPAQPSPAKKVRLSKANQSHLRFWNEADGDVGVKDKDAKANQGRKIGNINGSISSSSSNGYPRPAQSGYWSGAAARRKGSRSVRNNRGMFYHRLWEDLEAGANQSVEHQKDHLAEEIDAQLSDDESAGSQRSARISRMSQQALIRYQQPLMFSMSGNLEDLDWGHWSNLGVPGVVPVEGLQGNEVVLYQKLIDNNTISVKARKGRSDAWKNRKDTEIGDTMSSRRSAAFIKELDDDEDDGNMADDEGCEVSEEGPLVELEERIMDMELN